MKAILLGERAIADETEYDLRYFYFDDRKVGHCRNTSFPAQGTSE